MGDGRRNDAVPIPRLASHCLRLTVLSRGPQCLVADKKASAGHLCTAHQVLLADMSQSSIDMVWEAVEQ